MKFFCPEPLSSTPLNVLFYFRFAPERKVEGLFKDHLPQNFFETAEYVDRPEEAQAIILPNNFLIATADTQAYIAQFADVGERLHIPVFLFAFGDFSDEAIFDPRVYAFRLSLYKSTKGARDIIVPTLTEDIGEEGIVLREKGDIPTVSFCGQAGFSKPQQWVKYYLKVAWSRGGGLVDRTLLPRTIGVYWRRCMLAACRHSSLVKTVFITRHSFSGAYRTIELDPTRARKEFIDSIKNSDFVLAPKGDGNYSNRFLEVLAMGRIPVVPDTDIVLPFEETITYDDVVVRIPINDIGNTPEYIRAFYDKLTVDDWMGRQKRAREIFSTHLRQDVFFEQFFTYFFVSNTR